MSGNFVFLPKSDPSSPTAKFRGDSGARECFLFRVNAGAHAETQRPDAQAVPGSSVLSLLRQAHQQAHGDDRSHRSPLQRRHRRHREQAAGLQALQSRQGEHDRRRVPGDAEFARSVNELATVRPTPSQFPGAATVHGLAHRRFPVRGGCRSARQTPALKLSPGSSTVEHRTEQDDAGTAPSRSEVHVRIVSKGAGLRRRGPAVPPHGNATMRTANKSRLGLPPLWVGSRVTPLGEVCCACRSRRDHRQPRRAPGDVREQRGTFILRSSERGRFGE